MRQINEAGLKLIKEFEGCSLVAYQDAAGIWTIGYGCTHDVSPGMTITAEEAESRLRKYADATAVQVQNLLKWAVNDNQFSAIGVFAYNVGCGNLQKSTLLNCVNTGHLEDAAEEFLRWVKVAGIPSDGLLRRRKAERELFLTPV